MDVEICMRSHLNVDKTHFDVTLYVNVIVKGKWKESNPSLFVVLAQAEMRHLFSIVDIYGSSIAGRSAVRSRRCCYALEKFPLFLVPRDLGCAMGISSALFMFGCDQLSYKQQLANIGLSYIRAA